MSQEVEYYQNEDGSKFIRIFHTGEEVYPGLCYIETESTPRSESDLISLDELYSYFEKRSIPTPEEYKQELIE
jgi:hypothetical protein